MTKHPIHAILLAVAVAAGLASPTLAGAATFTFLNLDGPNEGFNDPTPVAPVGDNPGTTLGQQRKNVFKLAFATWGAILPSNVAIRVEARFDPLTPCDATSGVLGQAGAITIASDFPGAPIANTWFPIALANKIAGFDLSTSANDISAQFNSSVDNSTCLGSAGWYYGFDHNEGTNIDLLAVVLHELGHGLGFQTFTNLSTGAFLNGRPDMYARRILDDGLGLHWDQLSNGQRAVSALNTGKLVWDGTFVTHAAPQFLGPATVVRIVSPASLAGEKDFGSADFGPRPPSPPISAQVILAKDSTSPTSDGCEALTNTAQIAGRIALIDRGICSFTQKAERAQAAGAIAVIIANNVSGPPPQLTGSDPAITIPVVSITQTDAGLIENQLSLGATVTATIGVDPTHLAGADSQGRVKLYAPSPLELGSSVSHWDVTATPSLLMEPFITPALADVDLTQHLLIDLGWLSGVSGVEVDPPSAAPRPFSAPNPFSGATSIHFGLSSPGSISVEVFDARGALVKRMPDAWHPAGPQTVRWDGTDTSGRRAPAGVYYWRVVGGQVRETGRMVRVE
jgi:hypothetical protein